MAWFVAARLAVNTDVAHFLPDGAPGDDVRLAKQLAAGELSRMLVLLVETGSTEAAVRASREFEAALRAQPGVAEQLAFVDGGPPPDLEEELWRLYHPRRWSFVAGDADAAARVLSTEGIGDAVAGLKRRLASPMSTLLTRVAPGDPLLILPGLFQSWLGGRAEGLQVIDGRFVSGDGTAAVLFLATRASSVDAGQQRPFLAGVRAAFERVRRASGAEWSLLQSGAHRYAVAAEAAIKSDIQRVSIGSALGLAVLFALLFRSVRLVFMVLPVLGAAFLAGTTAVLLTGGAVHGLTLAFGAALIGVSVDYAVHFYCHHVLAPAAGGPRCTLRRILPALTLGAATTVLGFAALSVSAYPGLRELAWFAAAGVAAALAATWAFLPPLAGAGAAGGCARWASRGLARLLSPRGARRWVLALPVVLAVAVAAVGLPRLRWNDSLAGLNAPDSALLAEDRAVVERVTRYEQRRLVVAVGSDEQAALEVNDAVHGVLSAAVDAGELGAVRSLASWLPSASRQRAIDAAARGEEVWPRLRAALAAHGFRADAFAEAQASLATEPPAPLTWAALESSAMAPLVRSFRVTLGERVGFVSFLHELADEAAVQSRLAAIDGARLVDIEAVLSRAYGAYRADMSRLLGGGLVAVLLLVLLRHRALRPTAIAYLPAVLAAAAAMGVVALLGVELNTLSLVALLFVVCLGVDSGVFLAEVRGDRGALEATLLAVAVSGVTTSWSFLLLACSGQPSLAGIGLTAGVGTLCALLVAPTVCVLLTVESAEP